MHLSFASCLFLFHSFSFHLCQVNFQSRKSLTLVVCYFRNDYMYAETLLSKTKFIYFYHFNKTIKANLHIKHFSHLNFSFTIFHKVGYLQHLFRSYPFKKRSSQYLLKRVLIAFKDYFIFEQRVLNLIFFIYNIFTNFHLFELLYFIYQSALKSTFKPEFRRSLLLKINCLC